MITERNKNKIIIERQKEYNNKFFIQKNYIASVPNISRYRNFIRNILNLIAIIINTKNKY